MGRRFRKELESNETVKLDVLGFIKQPHAAPAELLDDAVVGDSLADERLGIKGCRVEASSLGRNRNVALLVPTLQIKKIESCVRWAKGHHLRDRGSRAGQLGRAMVLLASSSGPALHHHAIN